MSHSEVTPPGLVIAMTPAEKAAIQDLADAEGVTPEEMARRLGHEALQRRLQGKRRYPADIRGFPG